MSLSLAVAATAGSRQQPATVCAAALRSGRAGNTTQHLLTLYSSVKLLKDQIVSEISDFWT